MNKKALKNQTHVTMEKFLRNYLEIENEKVIEFLTSLNHHELKEVCEEMCKIKLHTLPFGVITPEEIQNGDILLVLDKSNNPAPYKNPKQIAFDQIIKEGKIVTMYDPVVPTFQDCIDDIENVIGNHTTSRTKIRTITPKKPIIVRRNNK